MKHLKLGHKIKKVAMYEPPYFSDEAMQQAWIEDRRQLKEALAQGMR